MHSGAEYSANPPSQEPLPDPVREAAAEWIVRLHDAGPEQRQALDAECEAWQAQDPRRRRVFEQMRQMWAALSPERKRRRNRRRASALGGLLLAALTLAQLPWSYWGADHRTATGEIRHMTLADGSEAVLNSNSAIDVDYGEDYRTIRLVRGEVMVTVQHDDDNRPFRVVGRDGSATALGTRYSVRVRDDYTTVAVQKSAVRVTPRNAPDRGITLHTGQRVRLSADGISNIQTVGRSAFSWVNRRLVFQDIALEDVVDELARYHRGILAVRDGLAERNLRFTGVLPADDIDAALTLLAASLPVKVMRLTPYLIWLEDSG